MYSKMASQWGCPTSPVVVSYSKGAVAPNLAPGWPCNKPSTCIKATPTKGITRKVSTKPITKLLKSNTLGGRRAGGNSRESDHSFPHFLTILVSGTTRCSSRPPFRHPPQQTQLERCRCNDHLEGAAYIVKYKFHCSDRILTPHSGRG